VPKVQFEPGALYEKPSPGTATAGRRAFGMPMKGSATACRTGPLEVPLIGSS
jgi:hypothetical protein